jgi:N12 class adenine-specific DNA methylase
MTREEAKREILFAKREVMADSYIDKAYDMAIKALEQPEIIQCKDCQHWDIHKRLNTPWCRKMHIDRGAEDFCSMAGRRDDG